MKKRFIKAISSLFFAVVLGYVCGYILYNTYSKETKFLIDNNSIYLIEYKKYSTYNSMTLSNINEDYTYYKDDNTYYKILGFTKDKDNIEKIKKIYKDINIVKCITDDKEFLNQVDNYDSQIKNISNSDKIKEILNSMINYYNDNKVEILKVNN